MTPLEEDMRLSRSVMLLAFLTGVSGMLTPYITFAFILEPWSNLIWGPVFTSGPALIHEATFNTTNYAWVGFVLSVFIWPLLVIYLISKILHWLINRLARRRLVWIVSILTFFILIPTDRAYQLGLPVFIPYFGM